MKKEANLLTLLFIILCGVCLAQNPPSERGALNAKSEGASKDQLADIKKMDRALGTTAEQIAESQPEVIPVLTNDARIILAEREQVFAEWEKAGYDEESRKKAEKYVWTDVRRGILKPNEPLTAQKWRDEARRRGRIKISSEPQKADIYVDDGANAVDKSNNFIFPPVGTRKFCLKLQGYQDHCESRTIENGINNPPIAAKLQEKK